MAGTRYSRRILAEAIVAKMAAGEDYVSFARTVVQYLAATRRSAELELLLNDVAKVAERYGSVTATVVSAHEMSAGVQKAVKAAIKAVTAAKNIDLDTRVDEHLLGGLKLELPTREYDASVRQALQQLKRAY